MNQNVVEANRLRDVLLTDEKNCYLLPQGWCDDWSVALGFTGGLDFIDDEDCPSPEIYCYAPLFTTPNSEVATLFIKVTDLQAMREVTEAEAQTIHPALFEELEHINKE